MEAGRIGGWDVDIESGRRFWFGKTHELMGFARDHEPSMDGAWDRVHPEDRERLRSALEYARLNKKRFEEEFRVQWPDGSIRWLRSQGRYFYAPNGEPRRLLGVSVDITNRKRVEAKLAEREQRLQLAIKAGKMYAYEWDVASDRMVRSGEYRDVLGYEPPSTRNAILPRIHPDDVRFFHEAAQRTPENPDVQVTYRLMQPDGGFSWLENTGRAYFDESGKMVRMLGMIADVTDRKAAEEVRSRHAAIVECSEDSIISHDLDGTIDTWNAGAEKMFGYTQAEAIGQPITLLVPAAQQQEEEQRNLNAVRLGRRIEHFETTRITKSGKTINISLSISPLKNSNGHIIGVSRIARDITEQKRAEEALANVSRKLIEIQEEERKRIARELHDDINQRVALVAIRLQSLKEENVSAEVASQLDSLFKDVNAVSKGIESVSHQLHSSQLEYLGIVAAMNSFCREFAERQSVAVAFRHGDIPKKIESDVSLCLFRVMQEALSNAVKHSSSREFEVILECSEGQLELAVCDRGAGFDTEAVAQKGRLGLVSMRERVRVVNGTIRIDSKPMGGTTIHVNVPLTSEKTSVGTGS
jgi:PAS domain S-box-containing protein